MVYFRRMGTYPSEGQIVALAQENVSKREEAVQSELAVYFYPILIGKIRFNS